MRSRQRGPSMSFTTSAGLQYEDRQLRSGAQHRDRPARGTIEHRSGGGVRPAVRELNTREKTFAMYGQEQLKAFDERLLAEVGLRAERSSVFGNTDKYFVYPKASAAYRFPNLLGDGSDFKLRAAYGETGNQPLFGQKFTTLVGGVNIGGNVGTQVGGVAGAPNIEPERVKEFEAGFDASPFHGRATLDFTWYMRHTTNLLLARTPPPSSGYGELITNGGELRNSGIEDDVRRGRRSTARLLVDRPFHVRPHAVARRSSCLAPASARPPRGSASHSASSSFSRDGRSIRSSARRVSIRTARST